MQYNTSQKLSMLLECTQKRENKPKYCLSKFHSFMLVEWLKSFRCKHIKVKTQTKQKYVEEQKSRGSFVEP